MATHQHNATLGGLLAQHRQQLPADRGIQVGERFIEDQQFGLLKQGPSQQGPLLLAPGELGKTRFSQGGQTHGLQGLGGIRQRFRRGACQFAESHKIPDGNWHLPLDGAPLWNQGKPWPTRGHGPAIPEQLSQAWGELAEQQFQQGGFAGAIRPEQRRKASGLEAETHLRQNRGGSLAGIAVTDALNLKHRQGWSGLRCDWEAREMGFRAEGRAA